MEGTATGLDYERETVHMDRLPEPERRRQAARFDSRLRVYHYETGRETVAPHGGPLTIKTVFRGTERFAFGGRRLVVRPGQVLLVPHGLVYGSEIAEPTETFSAYYPAPLRQDLLQEPGADPEPARPARTASLPLAPLRAGPEAIRALAASRTALAEGEMARAEECLIEAARHVVARVAGLLPALDGLPAASPAVREELLRRVLRAREHIDDDLSREAGLGELSAVACLSRFHLLRSFRAAFGETPAAYRMRRRLEVARDLLRQTDRPVNLVGQSLGFASHTAFTRRFRLAFGVTPSALRRRAI
ncbi:helix-turn-helix domain-containing protein [Muricoccus radiodurans]|uniref:helix-turn-helix domain-containing protein n=1 Tax=Muricoccus radiodurans TaxID=2231721 RepID=UPI003CEAB72F